MSDEHPQVDTAMGPGNTPERRERHPAYGMIGVARRTGRTHLYGSDFDHHSMMVLSIRRSEVRRGLSQDWYSATGPDLVEVALSESQWARLLSSPNIGDGVPCTIRAIQGERVPGLAPPTPKADLFKAELSEKLDDAIAALEELRARVEAGKGGKDSLRLIDRAIQQIEANTGFVAKQFGEHMEDAVERAKEEVNAYASATFARIGLTPPPDAPPPALPPAPEERSS